MLAAAALLLPAIIVIAVWTNNQFDQRRVDVERKALDAAREMVALADAEADANGRVLSLMAGSRAALDADMTGMTRFFRLSLAENPTWKGLVLRDVSTDRVLLEMGRGAKDGQLRPAPATLPGGTGAEGVFAQGRYCPCVVFDKRVMGAPERVLTLYMDPAAFQAIMKEEVAGASVGALVDRDGRFLGRSLDFARRVGTPGTAYVRAAAAAGGEGFYEGVTYEGLKNYTAYATSKLTGWSGHVAVDRSQIDSPRTLANASVAAALVAALVLAAGLSFYAANETRGRRREEERLVAMQKAEAISRFTSTTVHDFRNILAVIEAGVRLIVRGTHEPVTVERAEAVNEAVERGKRLTNQLLSFVRGDGASIARMDLRKCIEAIEELLGRSLGDGIEFRWSVDEDARFVRGNADQLELALLNLAINARDAMSGSGAFTIDAAREGNMAAIAACDSGPGVPAHLRERIFERFYSTKGDSRGTGLGLAQVAGAARQAGGRVELRDNPGGGACFVVYLPLE